MRTVAVLPAAPVGPYKPPQQMVYHLPDMSRVMQNPHVSMPPKVVIQKTTPVKTLARAVDFQQPQISSRPVQSMPMVQPVMRVQRHEELQGRVKLIQGAASSEASDVYIPWHSMLFLHASECINNICTCVNINCSYNNVACSFVLQFLPQRYKVAPWGPTPSSGDVQMMQIPQGLMPPNQASVVQMIQQPLNSVDTSSRLQIKPLPQTLPTPVTTTFHSLTAGQSIPSLRTERSEELPGTVKLNQGVESLEPSGLASASKSFFR